MEGSKVMSQNIFSVRYRSAPNIALIKYWGKYHESEILPINDSIGLTLNTDDLCTITSCSFSQEYTEDQLELNGKKV
jgi:diphosphomevalonate decarboxylase